MRSRVFSRLQTILIEPPARVQDVARRYQSRLLNIFLPSFSLAFAGVDATFLCVVTRSGGKKHQAEVRDSADRLQLALDAARMGTWSWNLESGFVSWSEKVAPMFGMKPEDFDQKFETYLSRIHPEDLP